MKLYLAGNYMFNVILTLVVLPYSLLTLNTFRKTLNTHLSRELFLYVGKTMFQLAKNVAKMDAFLVHYYHILSDTVRFHSAMWSEPCLR